ncbi:MAG: AtpZ/AtpI family protein [Desulfovibrionaceae bacterium]
MGTTFLSCILIGTAFGYFLYTIFGSIWFFFSFIIFGFLSGVKNVYMDAKKIIASDSKRKKEENTGTNDTLI